MMKKLVFLAFVAMVLTTNAQHTISGTFSPGSDFTWVLAYKLEVGAQFYVADDQVSEGQFSLELPENSTPGTYRLVYAVPQDEFYIDVLFNGKDSINLSFSLDKGITYHNSPENSIYDAYFRDINAIEQQIMAFYASPNKDKRLFRSLIKQLETTQQKYEKESMGLLVHVFIAANRPYIPKGFEAYQEYIKNKKEDYFDEIDVSDPLLQASGYLTNKLINYAFTAIPLEAKGDNQIQTAVNENIQVVSKLLDETEDKYRLFLFHRLWEQAVKQQYDSTSDYIFENYLKSLATEMGNSELVQKIEIRNRLRIGAAAPEIIWKTGTELKKLSTLPASERYLLVFWSSGCSHCLDELPKLHDALLANPGIIVLAVGLEDDKISWTEEASKLSHFNHAISLGKWESEYAELYDIQQTPTYYILDKVKRIVAKPADYLEVLELLN